MITRSITNYCWQERLCRTTWRSSFTCSTSSHPTASSREKLSHIYIVYLRANISPGVCVCVKTRSFVSLVTLRASWRSLLTSLRRTKSRSFTTSWGLTCCGGWRLTSSRTCPPRRSWSSGWSWALCRSMTLWKRIWAQPAKLQFPCATLLAYFALIIDLFHVANPSRGQKGHLQIPLRLYSTMDTFAKVQIN